MTLNDLAYDVFNVLNGGKGTHTDVPSLRQIKYNIKAYRARLIRRELARPGVDRQVEYEQDLGLVRANVDSPIAYWDTTSLHPISLVTVELPLPVKLKNEFGITHIGYSGHYKGTIPLVDYRRVEFKSFQKYTSTREEAFYLDKRVFINGVPISRLIQKNLRNEATVITVTPVEFHIRGIFEDPEKAHNFNKKNGEWDDGVNDFPVSRDMGAAIVEM